MPNTFSDPYIVFAFRAGIAAVSLTLLLVLVIVLLRLQLRTSLRREKAFIALWRPLLLAVASDAPHDAVPLLPRRDHLFFLKLWNYLQESLRGPANERLNQLARSLKCDAAARHFLRKGKRAERLLAILTLGHLRDQASWDDLAAQAGASDSLASIHAARALTRIDPLQATEHLLPLLLQRSDWDVNQIAGFLGEARQAFWLRLATNLVSVKEKHWPRALQLADALHLELPLQSMLFILRHCQSAEALVAALHMATGLPLLPVVRSYVRHPDWRVRMEVARFLSSFGDNDDIALLQLLLEDTQWWVRYQAARSLASMPFFGPEQLQLLRAGTRDTLSMAMLDHVLAEHNAVLA